MNENTTHLSISGLTGSEAGEITKRLPLRHGISLTITDLALVEDEPDVEQTALADILFELRKITAPPEMHTIAAKDLAPATLGDAIRSAEQTIVTAKDLAPGAITQVIPDGVQVHPAPPLTPPPVRALGYLGTLVVDLPGNSVVVAMGRDRDSAVYTYDDIFNRIGHDHPDEITKVVRANGREHVVLRNGTVLRPQYPAQRGRTEQAADLVIINQHDGCTNELRNRAVHAVAPKAGRIVLADDGCGARA